MAIVKIREIIGTSPNSFEDALNQSKVDAVAAANIFHYQDQSVYLAKKHLFDRHYQVHKPFVLEIERI